MRLGLLKKRGSLSLSINAIVVLIMAITMLGIGLAFMRNSMGSTMKQFENVNEQIKDEMIKDLKSSSERLSFKGEDLKFKPGDKRDVYFAVKNDDASNSKTFAINVACDTAMIDGATCAECTKIKVNTFASVTIGPNDVKVGKAQISLAATIKPDTYSCHIYVDEGATTTGSYGKKEFYVTVE